VVLSFLQFGLSTEERTKGWGVQGIIDCNADYAQKKLGCKPFYECIRRANESHPGYEHTALAYAFYCNSPKDERNFSHYLVHVKEILDYIVEVSTRSSHSTTWAPIGRIPNEDHGESKGKGKGKGKAHLARWGARPAEYV
jgi:hypothetical protein